jgi:hypothetical protein
MEMDWDHLGSRRNSLTAAVTGTEATKQMEGVSPEPNQCQWTQKNAAIQAAAVARSPVTAGVLWTSTGTCQSLDGSDLPAITEPALLK